MVKLGLHIIVFNVYREHVIGIMNLLSSMGRMWVLFFFFVGLTSPFFCFCCFGACFVLLLHGFVAKEIASQSGCDAK